MSGHRDPASLGTRVFTFLKDHVKISLFLLFNSFLPLTDVFTDSITSFELHHDGHVLWSTMTFFLMWNPFIVHLLAFLFNFSRSKCNSRKQFEALKEFKHLMFFFPFITPLKNIYYAYRLHRLRFGMHDFEAKNAKEVERIQHETGSAGMYESFLESGPQSVLQLKIILSTGSFSTAQKISLPISIFSLAWASSRAYFIQRDEDNSDPDPEIKMVAMRIFPWMLIVVIHSLTVWTCIAGLLGEYLFPCMLVYPFVAYGFQAIGNSWSHLKITVFCFHICSVCISVFYGFALYQIYYSSEWLGIVTGFSFCFIVILTIWNQYLFAQTINAKANQSDENSRETSIFLIKSILTSVWLPCVVGSKPFTFFLSAMASLFYKNFLFLFAALLNYNEVIHINVFLLWCVGNKTEMYNTTNLEICHSLQNCFDNTEDITSKQKLRACNENQNLDFLVISLVFLNISSLLSVIAFVKLENLTDYVYFYKSTKTFLCFPTKPVVHRSLVFTLASSDEHQKLLEEVAEDKSMINRPRRGETPLHYSTKMGAARCTQILLRKGAELKENGEDPPVVPPVIELAVQKGYAPILETVARLKQTNPGMNYLGDREIVSALQRQDEDRMKTSLRSPAFARSMVSLLLSIETSSEDFRSTSELEFLQNRMRIIRALPDERKTRGEILIQPTIVSLLTWKNQSGETVLQELTVAQDNLMMMLALAWSAVSQSPELVPEVKEGILNLADSDFITAQDCPLRSSTMAELMTLTNARGETLLQEKTLNKSAYRILLSLAMSALNEFHKLIPEVRREIVKVENEELLDEEAKNFTGPTIAALITFQDEINVPVLQDTNLSERSYSNLISLALSVLEDVPSTSQFPSRSEEEEETERLEIAAKILPELTNIRPEEKERVSSQLKDICQKMRQVISKERNKGVKEELEQNHSIPSATRRALGLRAISENVVCRIVAFITYEDETNVPILQDESLSERSYSNLISLALSVLEDVPSDNEFPISRSEEEEETKRLEAAAKVLPELTNIRPEEKERVSSRLKDIYRKMRRVISKERNKGVKEELEQNNSIPSATRRALGLRAISENVV